MTPIETNFGTDTPVWSAQNLPKVKASRMQCFSVLAVAAGLIVIVLASALKDPITTTGTQMEPARFTDSAQDADKAATRGIVVAASMN